MTKTKVHLKTFQINRYTKDKQA